MSREKVSTSMTGLGNTLERVSTVRDAGRGSEGEEEKTDEENRAVRKVISVWISGYPEKSI